MTTRQKEIIGIAFLILAVFIWVRWCTTDIFPLQAKRPEYIETPQQRKLIERRIAYHGLNGVVVLRESNRGWEFSRDGQWCKL